VKNFLLYISIFLNITVIVSLWKQYKAVPEKSGESVSNKLFVSSSILFLLMLFYGIMKSDTLILVNSIMVLPSNILVTYSLFKYKGFKRSDYITAVIFFLFVAALFVVKIKDSEIVAFSIFVARCIFIIDQPWQIIKTKTRGVVKPSWLFIYMIGNIFWGYYFYITKQLLLMSASVIYFTVFLVTLVIWALAKPLQKDLTYNPMADEFQRF
jgi:hypothetical protein